LFDQICQEIGVAVIATLDLILPAAFGLAAVIYLWLAVRVSRASGDSSTNAISYFLFLIGTMVAGSAFAYNATDENIHGIGRTLSFLSGGFLPVVLYMIYREFTVGRPGKLALAVLSIVPVATTLLTITNPLHDMIWSTVEVDGIVRFTDASEHTWFNRVHAPFAYGLFAVRLRAFRLLDHRIGRSPAHDCAGTSPQSGAAAGVCSHAVFRQYRQHAAQDRAADISIYVGHPGPVVAAVLVGHCRIARV
jgi:hypothetical protein